MLEKAILRWRLKRKGFRGLQVQSEGAVSDEQVQASVAEEDFFQASRKLAEERVERSVVRVQAMFRSKLAQEEYARMKLAHNTATVSSLHTHFSFCVLYSIFLCFVNNLTRILSFFFLSLQREYEELWNPHDMDEGK